MDVEHHWLPGVAVNWKTGEPTGKPATGSGKHTHCSAFAAEACRRLGIYLLRPPEHSQELLANAQYDWLSGAGKAEGWSQVNDPYEAQHDANQGYMVVAVYKEHDPKRPGHIAIIRLARNPRSKLRPRGRRLRKPGATMPVAPRSRTASPIIQTPGASRRFATSPIRWASRDLKRPRWDRGHYAVARSNPFVPPCFWQLR